jgi:GDPmannose 4,6-dehydratase
VAKIKLGKLPVLELGNLGAKRDWGFAKEYVEGMWMMLQAEEPTPSCWRPTGPRRCASSSTWRSRRPATSCASKGEEQDEVGIDIATGKTLVRVNPKFYRPAEVDLLIGNPARAKEKLGWEPKTTLEELCTMMVKADLRRNAEGHSF